MADLTAAQKDKLTFLTGIDENGAVAADTYFSWSVGENLGKAWLSKWNNDANGAVRSPTSAAGTPGGTVTYAFGAGLADEEEAGYEAALTLWSDIANIQFRQTDDVKSANIRLDPTDEAGGGGVTFIPANGPSSTRGGITAIPSQNSPNTRGGQLNISIAAPDQQFNSFSPDAAHTLTAVTHELGHALGLGHAGQYNGDEFAGQSDVYDSQLWSVMSYVKPDDPRGAFNASSPVKGANWTVNNSGVSYGLYAQTPMVLDIPAIQRIYGASTSSTFAGGQTYGFNTNISGQSRQFYDFTNNTDPVLTIYNRGVGNTLDVSGFTTNSTINLNPGTFSSASTSGTLVNNIGVAYGTKIDKAIGGGGNDVFYTNADGDVIDGGTGTDTVRFAGARNDYTVTKASNGETFVVNKSTGAADRLTNVENLEFDAQPVCFTTGTRIAILRSGRMTELPVEALAVGDVAVTAQGQACTIRWIGHRTIGAEKGCIAAHQWPVRIRAGAFGRDDEGRAVPARDLSLSPGHPVLIDGGPARPDGVLVPISCLINGTSVARQPVSTVTYWHVELDRHDILLAEGLPAESYLDGGDRAFFGQASDHALHNPDFVAPGWSARCRPVATEGALVEAERRRLDMLFAATLEGDCVWSPAETMWASA